jgi:hypothetical protein
MSIEWHTSTANRACPACTRGDARKITGTTARQRLALLVDVDRRSGGLSQGLRACRQLLPPTYPHILAFALQMQLLTQGFSVPAAGVDSSEQPHPRMRPMGGISRAQVSVRVHNLQPHPKGNLRCVTTLDDQLGLWEAESQMLCRGVKLDGEPVEQQWEPAQALTQVAQWKAPADIGRQYARSPATTTRFT